MGAAALVLTAAATAQEERFRELRDEGIANIGWVAGNAYGHPIWPQVKKYVGEGGIYYDVLVRLAPRGSNPEVEADHNVRLYRKWREKGSNQPFKEAEATSRIRRANQIAEELRALMDKMDR